MTLPLRDRSFDELSTQESYALWRLRQQVFVVEQASPYPDLDGRDLEPDTRHLTIADGQVLVACLRLLTEPDGQRIGRLAVAPSQRHQGLAGHLMDAALLRVGDRRCRLDAQTALVDFYARYGFRIEGPEFVEGGVAHLPMMRAGSG